MAEFLVAGNWKLNLNPQQATEFCQQFLGLMSEEDQAHSVLFPSAVAVDAVCKALVNSKIQVGGQNAHTKTEGAFTGENSASMFKQMGCDWLLIAHSERRQYFAENNESIKAKLMLAVETGLRPMLCIGETLEQRESGETAKILESQLEVLKGFNWGAQLAIAYEPVWAIGTGKVATPAQVDETHAQIRTILNTIQSGLGDQATLLYGGSVKPENAEELSSLENVNGFLVGGASLKPEVFSQISAKSRHRF